MKREGLATETSIYYEDMTVEKRVRRFHGAA